MDDWLDIALRLGAATLIGGAIGLNRDLHHKSTGLRTLGLVALGAALAAVVFRTGSTPDIAAASRVVQGVVAGIGFLGAGVILRTPSANKIHGLTTAASIWVTAGIGVACGSGAWTAVIAAAILAALLLIAGGPLEKAIHQRFARDEDEKPPETAA
jgi:putative Mg2+ transporter-C (MgtC) family protein